MGCPRWWPLLLLLPAPASLALVRPPKRVAVVGGGFAGLTAARNLASHAGVEVLLCDQRSYFEYTPGILRAWVEPQTHTRLVKPLSKLLPRKAQFQRVMPGHTTRILESDEGEGCPAPDSGDAAALASCPLMLSIRKDAEAPLLEYPCDFVILATGGELGPVSDDRQTAEYATEGSNPGLLAAPRQVCYSHAWALPWTAARSRRGGNG